jgi:hypothetical protein
MDWTPFAEGLFRWLPNWNKVLFALFLLSGLVLFLPWSALTAMHLEKFAAAYRAEEWLVFLFCAAVLLAEVIHRLYLSSRARREIDIRLECRTAAESVVIAELLKNGQTLRWPHEAGIESLHKDGLLWRENGPYDNRHFVYGLTKTARIRAIALGIGKPK